METRRTRFNHRQAERYIHPASPKTLIIRLRIFTPSKETPVKCFFHFSGGTHWQSKQMHLSVETLTSRYYEIEIAPEQPLINYFFEAEVNRETFFVGEDTSTLGSGRNNVKPYVFSWKPDRIFETPDWVHRSVFYQIFPERFYNGDPTNDPVDLRIWGESPTRECFFGGDLAGIQQKIPYLVDLGISAVWLNPIFTSASNHKYNTHDYMTIDPHFGDEKTFRSLVNRLHENGIKIILDGVFNHTGTNFWAFRDVIENGEQSAFKDWYYIHEFPVRIHPHPTYECWWDVAELPKLKVSNPEVRQYLLDVAAYWTKEFNIDGWRLDVPNEIAHDFWVEFRKIIKEINPDCYIVGEIWDDGRPWLQGDQFDAVMNYLFRDNVLNFFARNRMEVTDFDHHMGMLRLKYPRQVTYAMLNLLGSHDTARVLTVFEEEYPHMSEISALPEIKKRIRPAVIFQMTYPGAPMVFYGDEVGMRGGADPGCRGTMLWDEDRQDLHLKRLYKCLIRARKQSSSLTAGSFIPVCADNEKKIYCFARRSEDELALVVLNTGPRDRDFIIPIDGLGVKDGQLFQEVLSGETYRAVGKLILVPRVDGLHGMVLISRE